MFISSSPCIFKDFIINNVKGSGVTARDAEVDARTWQFWESSIKIRETKDPTCRVREPHVLVS